MLSVVAQSKHLGAQHRITYSAALLLEVRHCVPGSFGSRTSEQGSGWQCGQGRRFKSCGKL